MDFDIGNILYVVITLVAIIASLLGKKKKKPGEKESKPGFLDNLDKILKMGQEDPAVVTLEDYEHDLFDEVDERDEELVSGVSEEVNDTPSLLEEYERLLISRGGSVVEEMHYEGGGFNEPLEVIELEDETVEKEGTDYFEIVKDFDAGTAVVYSAIINRVEY